MPPSETDSIPWRDPWAPVPPEIAAHCEGDLRRELHSSHALFGCPARALGRREDCDDVLFQVEHPRARYAVIHLTYQAESCSRWPATELYATLEECVRRRLELDAADFRIANGDE